MFAALFARRGTEMPGPQTLRVVVRRHGLQGAVAMLSTGKRDVDTLASRVAERSFRIRARVGRPDFSSGFEAASNCSGVIL